MQKPALTDPFLLIDDDPCMTAIGRPGRRTRVRRPEPNTDSPANETPCGLAAPRQSSRAETPSVSCCLCRRRPVVRFALAGPAPCIKGVVHGQPVLQHRVVIRVSADSPSDSARSPAPAVPDPGARYRRPGQSRRACRGPGPGARRPAETCRSCTALRHARRARRRGCRRPLRRSSRPRRRPARSARRESWPGSIKRRISHGQAIRSIFGRSRVTQLRMRRRLSCAAAGRAGPIRRCPRRDIVHRYPRREGRLPFVGLPHGRERNRRRPAGWVVDRAPTS